MITFAPTKIKNKKQEENKMSIYLNVELYKEGKVYGAYIGDNGGGSGIDVKGSTPEEAAEELKPYIADYLHKLKKKK